jgi:hypothetical protein
MKTKYTAMLFSILLIMGLVAPFVNNAKAVPTQPTVYVSPASVGPLAPLSTFTVSVLIDSPDIAIWSGQIGIAWNPAVLNCTSFAKGAVPASDGGEPFPWLWLGGSINNTGGWVTFSGWSASAGDEPGWTGTAGEFIKYTFKVLAYYSGNVALHLTTATTTPEKFYKTKLNQKLDTTIAEITPITLVDGTFVGMTPPTPYGPTAHLVVATPPPYYEGTTAITFDGSTSTPGFDGINFVPIDTYIFDFGDLSPIQSGPSPTAIHTFAAFGLYIVNLTVHAATLVNPYSTDLKPVTIYAKALGAAIDLYTDSHRSYMTDPQDHWTPYNGTGPFLPADAYTSQDLVTLYAKVTYNDDAVAHKVVAFEVHYPNGNITVLRTAMTDLDGIASISFRIPAPCEGADAVFGTWFVYADVDVAEKKVYDNMTFLVGWIIDTYDHWMLGGLYGLQYNPAGASWLHVSPDPVQKGGVLSVTDKMINIAYVNVWAQFAITLYDVESYPIGFMTFGLVVPGRTYPDGPIVPYDMGPYTFTIPMWAYVGLGAVFMNAYTNLPSECGLPYGPEEVVYFAILKA